jgi:hypothetical protein
LLVILNEVRDLQFRWSWQKCRFLAVLGITMGKEPD